MTIRMYRKWNEDAENKGKTTTTTFGIKQKYTQNETHMMALTAARIRTKIIFA